MSLRNFPVGATRDNSFNRTSRNSQNGYNFPEAEKPDRPRMSFNEFMNKWTSDQGDLTGFSWAKQSTIPSRVPTVVPVGKRPKHKILETLKERAQTLSPSRDAKHPCPGQYPNRTSWKLHKYGADELPTRFPGGIDYRLPEMQYF